MCFYHEMCLDLFLKACMWREFGELAFKCFCKFVGVAVELLDRVEKFPRNVFVQMPPHILEVDADGKQLDHFSHC